MQTHNAVIVLADISGYTRFIHFHGIALTHAESIITELLDSIIDHTAHPLILNKLEGDAALFYALADENPQAVAESALRQVNGFFEVFSARKQEIGLDGLCNCTGCTEVVHLNIKAVLNFGSIVVKQVRQFEEISGTPVIIAHRLLKNSVPLEEYVLLAEDFERALCGTPPGGIHITEHCQGTAARLKTAQAYTSLRYVDNYGQATETYPLNPNGSAQGITGLTTADGRFSIMMPHPERLFRAVQHSWRPAGWHENGAWLRMFQNARKWVG